MAVATAHKRDHVAIIKELDDQLAAYPALADSAIYNKPVGRVVEITCRCGKEYQSTPNKIARCPSCGKTEVAQAGKPYMKFAQGPIDPRGGNAEAALGFLWP